MNCTAALEAILDAEPTDLAGQGTTSLAAHIVACNRCRAVAHRISVETGLLASSIAPSEVRRRVPSGAPVWVRGLLVPVGLAAALVLALVSRTPHPPNVIVSVASPKPAIAVPEPVVSPRVATGTAPVSVQRTPSRVRAYPAPIPVAAVRISPQAQTFAPPRVEGGATVIVDPQPGQRVAVMRTSNPKITVVWLY